MIKAVILDIDGVTIEPRKAWLKQRLKTDFRVDESLVNPLFIKDYDECVVGKKDLKEVLEKSYLEKWGWVGTTEEFFKYWWKSEETPNNELLKTVNKYREKGLKFILLLEQEKYRANHLLNDVGLKNYVDRFYMSYQTGMNKTNKKFLEMILKENELNPEEVMMVDDEDENLISPKELGIKIYLFKDNQDFEQQLQQVTLS